MKKAPSASEFDTLEDTSSFARPTDDFGESQVSQDHVANLEHLHEMLVRKRRYLAQDVITYPVVFLGRAQDINNLQGLIDSVEKALAHERALAG
jgi:hypothetical protein